MSEQRSQLSLTGSLAVTLKRECLIAIHSPGQIINPLMFFVIAVTLFPLAGGADPAWMSSVAAGVVWTTALLAVMLSMDSLFRSDYDDGSLEQMLLSPQPLYFQILIKVFAHWLLTGLPLVILAPVLAYMLALPTDAYAALVIGLLLGTPTLSMIGAIGTALTVGVARSGLLLAVLILPLSIPVLVFGAGMVENALNGMAVSGIAAVMGALLVLALTFAPLAIGAALRISVN